MASNHKNLEFWEFWIKVWTWITTSFGTGCLTLTDMRLQTSL